MTQTAPGYQDQRSKRTALRILGVVLFGGGLVLTVVAFADLFSTMSSDDMEVPSRFFLAFIGLPLLGVGGWCLQLGFLGAAAKYSAGEVAPTARDTLGFMGLTDGGVTCANCGSRNPSTAKFCDDCGRPLARSCSGCGKANAGDARFCADCGNPLG